MARAVPVFAGIRPGKAPAHLRPAFINAAVAARAQVTAGEELLPAEYAERDQHRGDEFDIGNQLGGGGVSLPAGVFLFHHGMRVFEREGPAAVAGAAGAGINASIRWIVDSHGLL